MYVTSFQCIYDIAGYGDLQRNRYLDSVGVEKSIIENYMEGDPHKIFNGIYVLARYLDHP